MVKKKLVYASSAVALLLGSGLFFPSDLFAQGESRVLESCDGVENCAVVTSTAELSSAFAEHKSKVLMGASFDLTADLRTGADMELYLNNYTLTSDGWSIINVEGVLTIYAGENGKIVETGGTYAPLYVYGSTVMKSGTIETAGQAVFTYYDTGLFTMDGGVISGGSNVATTVAVSNGAKMVMNGGEINADTWGVSVFKDAEFEMNGGTITVSSDDGIGVSGNGSMSGNNEGTNAKLTLNDGIINSGDLGVYAPQVNGVTVLGEGITINAGNCGVEVRAGELSVAGATINVDENAEYVFNPNGNGSTASGVGIAVAQHTTKQGIVATVSDGMITAPVAFAEANPQHNGEEAIAEVELSITGGEFNATNGDPVVASEDVEKFITGGTFNKKPTESYVADGYDAYPAKNMTLWNVLPVSQGAGEDDTDDEGDSNAIAEELGNVANDILGKLRDEFNDLSGDIPQEFVTPGGAAFWVFPDAARNALEHGNDLKATLGNYEYELSDFGDDTLAEIQTMLGENKNIFAILSYWIDLHEGGDGWIGEVTEIPYPITLTYDVSGAPAVPEGATRVWTVTRFHGDCEVFTDCQIDTIEASYDATTGLISFENDKFSFFVAAYEDVIEGEEAEEADAAATPETGTMTASGASAVSAALVTAITVGILTTVVSFVAIMRRR